MEIAVKPKPPFDFSLTAGAITRYREESGADTLLGGVYRRVFDDVGRCCLVSVNSVGSVGKPELRITIEGENITEGDRQEFKDKISWTFGMEDDLDGFYALARQDEFLGRLVSLMYGLKPTRTSNNPKGRVPLAKPVGE